MPSIPAQGPDNGGSGTTADLRRKNLGLALRAVHLLGPIPRAELTERLGLARGTVGILIDTLVEAGYLVEREPETSGRGRPSPIIDVVPKAAVALALELEPDRTLLSVTGLGGRLISRAVWPHPSDNIDQIIAHLTERLGEVSRRCRKTGARYQAVGIAVWGVVRSPDGYLNTVPSTGWKSVPLGDRIREGLTAGKVKTRSLAQHVVVGNDANLGALAEYRRGAGRGSRRLLYVRAALGTGAGLVWDGTLLSESGGYGGEVGHMVIDPSGQPCHCGAIGCWETEVDQRAFLRAAGQGDVHLDELDARAQELLDAARGGNPSAWAAAEKVATMLGIGLANLVQILGPDRIVLGDYLADLVQVCPLPTRRILQERGFSHEARHMPLVPAELGKNAPTLGAAELALEPLLADPATYF